VRYSKNGKVVLTTHNAVSADGKTVTVDVKGTSAQGQPVDAVIVYDNSLSSSVQPQSPQRACRLNSPADDQRQEKAFPVEELM
jgi:hypothetical protein